MKQSLTVRPSKWSPLALASALFSGSCSSFGASPHTERLARMQKSPNFDSEEGIFKNPVDTSVLQPSTSLGVMWDWIRVSPRKPPTPFPVATPDPRLLASAPSSGLRVTWLGHSSVLVEMSGCRILTDPIWSARASPVGWAGSRRYQDPPLALAELGRIDVVLISHDHYDHLDMTTVRALAAIKNEGSAAGPKFLVPLGVGAHLDAWGVPREQIIEHDWWEETTVAGVRFVATPARHFSGRTLWDRFTTQWAGWALLSADHRVYFGGDTGLFGGLRDVGERLGPFALTMLEIGAYDPRWGQIHLGPEGALAARDLIGSGLLMPLHWGTFTLALHDWSQPIEQLVSLATERKTAIVTPRVGESFEPDQAPAVVPWWTVSAPGA